MLIYCLVTRMRRSQIPEGENKVFRHFEQIVRDFHGLGIPKEEVPAGVRRSSETLWTILRQ